MSEKIQMAFSSQISPTWDLEQLASKAKELGFAGVSLALQTEAAVTGFLHQDPANVHKPFAAAGVKLVSISTRIAPGGQASKDAELAATVRKLISSAAQLQCGFVRVFDPKLKTGQSTADLVQRTAEWLLPLADAAGQAGVELLVQNANALNLSRDLWALLDYSVHPALGVAWDQLAGLPEMPAFSVPTLNARLRMPILRDAVVNAGSVTWKKLGEGDLKVIQTIARLQGLGFAGFASFEMPASDMAEELLKDAITKFKDWTKPKEVAKPKPAPKPAAAKPAAPAAKAVAPAPAPTVPAAAPTPAPAT